jgi:hypothetical protein
MTMTHFTLVGRPALIFRTVCQFDAASFIPSVTGITLDGRRQTTAPIADVVPVVPHRVSIALRELAASASIEAALAKIAPCYA